jgi:hypothetical protein
MMTFSKAKLTPYSHDCVHKCGNLLSLSVSDGGDGDSMQHTTADRMSQSSAQNLLATICLDKNLKATSTSATVPRMICTKTIGSTLDSSGKLHNVAAIFPVSLDKLSAGNHSEHKEEEKLHDSLRLSSILQFFAIHVAIV